MMILKNNKLISYIAISCLLGSRYLPLSCKNCFHTSQLLLTNNIDHNMLDIIVQVLIDIV